MQRACDAALLSNQGNEADSRCQKLYYDTARDVLLLFRAIGPLVKAQDIQQVRHNAWV